MQPEQQQRIMGYFIEEAKEHLNTIEQGLLNLQGTIEDSEMINEVFRAAHSVKGGAAMLGIHGIQRVSHRLEDFFKILRESPARVDQKLETLFLQVFDVLKELLEQLQGPFGLTEEATSSAIATVEPIFSELEQHLNHLTGGAVTAETPSHQPFVVSASVADQKAAFTQDVPARLREMLQLFKQSESTASREQLQTICHELIRLGEQIGGSNWCHLLETAKRAISDADNSFRVLAPVVIKDIKQAQDLAIANRLDEISPCAQLIQLAPATESATPASDALDDLDDLFTSAPAQPSALAVNPEADALDDLFTGEQEDALTDSTNLIDTLDADLASHEAHQGPEVGVAELNSLADLFEGELPDLGATWQEEEVISDVGDLSFEPSFNESIDLGGSDSDFSDLLFDTNTPDGSLTSAEADGLGDLFGEADLPAPTSQAPAPLAFEEATAEEDDLNDFLDLRDTRVTTETNLFGDLDLDDLPSGYTDSASDFGAADASFEDLGNLFGGVDDTEITSDETTPLLQAISHSQPEETVATASEPFPDLWAEESAGLGEFDSITPDDGFAGADTLHQPLPNPSEPDLSELDLSGLDQDLFALETPAEAAAAFDSLLTSEPTADSPLDGTAALEDPFAIADLEALDLGTDFDTPVTPALDFAEDDLLLEDVSAKTLTDSTLDHLDESNLAALDLEDLGTEDLGTEDLGTEDLGTGDFSPFDLESPTGPDLSVTELNQSAFDLDPLAEADLGEISLEDGNLEDLNFDLTEPTDHSVADALGADALGEDAIPDPWSEGTQPETTLAGFPSELPELAVENTNTRDDFELDLEAFGTADAASLDDDSLLSGAAASNTDFSAIFDATNADALDFDAPPAANDSLLEPDLFADTELSAPATDNTEADFLGDLSIDSDLAATDGVDFDAPDADLSLEFAAPVAPEAPDDLFEDLPAGADLALEDLSLEDELDLFAEQPLPEEPEINLSGFDPGDDDALGMLAIASDAFDLGEPPFGQALDFDNPELATANEPIELATANEPVDLSLESADDNLLGLNDLGFNDNLEFGNESLQTSSPDDEWLNLEEADVSNVSELEANLQTNADSNGLLDFGTLENEDADFNLELTSETAPPSQELATNESDLAGLSFSDSDFDLGEELLDLKADSSELGNAAELSDEFNLDPASSSTAESFDPFSLDASLEDSLGFSESLNLTGEREDGEQNQALDTLDTSDELRFDEELGESLGLSDDLNLDGTLGAESDDSDLLGFGNEPSDLSDLDASDLDASLDTSDELRFDEELGESLGFSEDLNLDGTLGAEVDESDLLGFSNEPGDLSGLDTSDLDASLNTSDELRFDEELGESLGLSEDLNLDGTLGAESDDSDLLGFGNEPGDLSYLDASDLDASLDTSDELRFDEELGESLGFSEDLNLDGTLGAESDDSDLLGFGSEPSDLSDLDASDLDASLDTSDELRFDEELGESLGFSNDLNLDGTLGTEVDESDLLGFGNEPGDASALLDEDLDSALGSSLEAPAELSFEDEFGESLNLEASLDFGDELASAADSSDELSFDAPLGEISDLSDDFNFGDDFSAAEAPLNGADVVNFATPDLLSSESDSLDDLLAISDSTGSFNQFADLDDLIAEPSPSTESDFGEGNFGEAVLGEDEFGDLDDLLSESPQPNEFADLDDLLGEGASATSDSFADLDNLLADDAELAQSVSSAGLDQGSDEDFSDLEALLQPESVASVPASLVDATDAQDTDFADLDDLLKDVEERLGGTPSIKGARNLAARPARPSRTSEQTMRVPVKHLDNLSNLVGELVVNRNSLEQDQERLRQSLDNLLYQVQQLSDVGQRMQDLYERSLLESSLLASRQKHRVPSSIFLGHSNDSEHSPNTNGDVEYDPLEMDRFTGFHSLSQEMIELIVRVRESSSDIEFIVDETDQVTRMFRQVTTQLQEGLTRSRMMPFAQTADRLPRAVRDISIKVGKQAELIIEGRETLIDKMILEKLYDPLTHLVNNALAHGIESPESRRASGKSPAGRIAVRAFHQGNQTVISVSDDGAGIDVEKVKRKALEKGLLSPAEAQSLSRLDAYDLLFHPGFSTVDQVDEFRGRGVGMDVVRTSLSEIRGVINTDSTSGKGTTFTIRLPLTLSISKALCCISDRARIAFPMDGVEDMLDLPKERIQTNEEGQQCVSWRDTVLPLRPLNDLLSYSRHLSRGTVYGGNQEDDIVSIVVLRSAGNYLALEVDQVLGEQEIVIKQLEGPVPKPIGVAGATVLGDGRIMPIADVLELIDLSMGRIRRDAGGSLWEKGAITALKDPTPIKTEPMVLIVDDSITVRELLSMTFNKVGYRVEQARDGQEAWEKLRSGLPCDIVFCDIEMPRMDGLELLSRIQKDPALNHLPIAMLTSRGADRHRQMASNLGASGYFTKPYLEEGLLDAAQRMLKGEKLL